jgi:hypothetical protein
VQFDQLVGIYRSLGLKVIVTIDALAAETNLIRYGSARPVYDAVVSMTNAAAGDVLALRASQALYFSVQVDLAWSPRGERSGQAPLPLLVTEGGWTSASVVTVVSSPEQQGRWIRRQAALLDRASARYVFQLQFTDVDLDAFGLGGDPRLIPFVRLGLVDTALAPKPALAVWDSVFAVPLR